MSAELLRASGRINRNFLAAMIDSCLATEKTENDGKFLNRALGAIDYASIIGVIFPEERILLQQIIVKANPMTEINQVLVGRSTRFTTEELAQRM